MGTRAYRRAFELARTEVGWRPSRPLWLGPQNRGACGFEVVFPRSVLPGRPFGSRILSGLGGRGGWVGFRDRQIDGALALEFCFLESQEIHRFTNGLEHAHNLRALRL